MTLRLAYKNGREASSLIRGYSRNLREMTRCLDSAIQAPSETIPVGRELATLHKDEIISIGDRLAQIRAPLPILEWIAYRMGMMS